MMTPRKDCDPDLLEQIERDRKTYFIDKLGWDLQHTDDRETDEFDTPDSLVLTAGNPLLYSLRILPEAECMTRKLWPQAAHLIPHGGWEMSRWVKHRESTLKEMRTNTLLMVDFYRSRGMTDMFSISTDEVVKGFRLFGIVPDVHVGVDNDVNFCHWNLRR